MLFPHWQHEGLGFSGGDGAAEGGWCDRTQPSALLLPRPGSAPPCEKAKGSFLLSAAASWRGTKETEPESSQGGKVEGGEVMGTSCSTGNSRLDTRKIFSPWGWSDTGRGAQGGCGQPIHGDIQSLTKQSPDLALSRWAGIDDLQRAVPSSVLWLRTESRSICETTPAALLSGAR